MMAKFELQDDVQPVLKKKRNVPFASLEQINEELDKLEKLEFNQSYSTANESHQRSMQKKKKSKDTRLR